MRVWWLVWLWYLGSLGWFSWSVSFLSSSSLGVALHDARTTLELLVLCFGAFPCNMVTRSTIYHQPAHLLQGRRTSGSYSPFVALYIVHYLFIGIKISMSKLGFGGVWFWCLRSSSTSVPGEMLRQWLVQLQALLLSYRGQVDAWGRPHGEGSWADEFFYGECLQGTSVEGELLGKFQSRETGRMRHSSCCLWIVSGPHVLRHFGRTRKSRGSSDAWNPQNSSRRQLMG